MTWLAVGEAIAGKKPWLPLLSLVLSLGGWFRTGLWLAANALMRTLLLVGPNAS